MTNEQDRTMDPRGIIWTQEQIDRLRERLIEHGLYTNYQESCVETPKPTRQELIQQFLLEKNLKRKPEVSRQQITKKLRGIGRTILSKKNTQSEFVIENPQAIELSERNLSEAFMGRLKGKRKYDRVKKIGDQLCFAPIKKNSKVGFVTIEQDANKIRVFVEGKNEANGHLGRQAGLLLGRITNLINHTIPTEALREVTIGEINIKGCHFLGEIDNFDFTTANLIRLNKVWAKEGGYTYFKGVHPGIRVAETTRPSVGVGKIPYGKTVSELYPIRKDKEDWLIIAVQDSRILPTKNLRSTNFFIAPLTI